MIFKIFLASFFFLNLVDGINAMEVEEKGENIRFKLTKLTINSEDANNSNFSVGILPRITHASSIPIKSDTINREFTTLLGDDRKMDFSARGNFKGQEWLCEEKTDDVWGPVVEFNVPDSATHKDTVYILHLSVDYDHGTTVLKGKKMAKCKLTVIAAMG
jgi:hypothetical protein